MGEGPRLATDQYYTLNRDKGEDYAWLEMGESRYTMYQDIGAKNVPGLIFEKNGPHFADPAD